MTSLATGSPASPCSVVKHIVTIKVFPLKVDMVRANFQTASNFFQSRDIYIYIYEMYYVLCAYQLGDTNTRFNVGRIILGRK